MTPRYVGGRTNTVRLKVKAALFISLAILIACSSFGEEADPKSEPTRPQRAIKNLPHSVGHKKSDQGEHIYEISRIYEASKHSVDEDPDNSVYRSSVPDCTSFKLNFQNHTCTFSTSRELSLSELAYALDDMAELGGDLPYWCELEARDILPSELAGSLQYSTSTVSIDPPSGLAWFWMPDDQPLRIPLSFGDPDLGTLLIVPSTAHCMAHSRYVLRVLDGKGLLVWTDEKTLFAGVKIATSDVDEDSIHEIWIYRNDHGEEARFQIKGAFKK